MTRRPCILIAAGLTAAGLLFARPARTQEAAARQTGSINFRERPRYPFDPQRLKRRPVVDGAVGENEWDPLYTLSDTSAKGTVYVNWDDDFLYLAARTDQPAWRVFSLDMNADGWLRGADNLELTVSPATQDGGTALSARILDAAGNRDAPIWNDKVVDPRSIQVVQKPSGGGWVVELAIPKGIAGLSLRPGATLSCRADFLPALNPPATPAPYEPRLLVDISLVEARTITAPGLAPRLTLEDSKLVPGQALKATLELINQTEEETRIRAVTWKGEAGAADLLNTVREVAVPPVPRLKSLKRHFNSPIPETAVPGFYQITGQAQLENGRTVSGTASFSVVEPFEVKLLTEPETINVLGPTEIKVFVDIFSAVPPNVRGDVEIEVPAGWIVKGRAKKGFFIMREDAGVRAPFYVTLPSNTQAGDYIVHATLTWRGKTWKAHRTLKVTRTGG